MACLYNEIMMMMKHGNFLTPSYFTVVYSLAKGGDNFEVTIIDLMTVWMTAVKNALSMQEA